MASLIDDLNSLLIQTRSGLEAAEAAANGIECSDPDIESGLEDIIESERWSSSGLYHRITQLNGTPTLLTSDFASQVDAAGELKDKLKLICKDQRSTTKMARGILDRDDLDDPTKQLLTEIHSLHKNNATWCKSVIKEFEPSFG